VQRLRSIYITLYVIAGWLIAAIAVWMLWGGLSQNASFSWSWFGVLLVSLPHALFITLHMIVPTFPRLNPLQPIMSAVVLIGFLFALLGSNKILQYDKQALFLAAVGLIAYLLYIFWATKQTVSEVSNDNLSNLQVGGLLPNFSLKDHNGYEVYSDELLGSPTIIMFYRGNWCPFCRAQIAELASDYDKLSEKEAKVLLVSSQPAHKSSEFAKQLNVPFAFLVDEDNKLAKAWGLLSKGGLPLGLHIFGYKNDVPVPTVIVSNAQNEITFLDITGDYRIRPDSIELLNLLV